MNPTNRLVAGLAVLSASLVASGCMTPLQDAVNRGDLQAVRSLVEEGVPVNERSSLLGPPLQQAATNGRAEIVKVLLDHGADINAGQDNFTPPGRGRITGPPGNRQAAA
jgi:ankyrin repeat protein